MPYKVFLVEDEIVAREGIRDSLDWAGAGFQFCGEAADGELALPLIETARPDLLITDIKMPFMDGLELARIVKARSPQMKIVILSGHDEFHFAQEAIKLGVTEYLLKPVGVRELHTLLERIAAQLDAERRAQARLQQLNELVESDLPLRRARFLLRLLTVGADATEAVEESRALGLELIAAGYGALVLKVEFDAAAGPDQYSECETAYRLLVELTTAAAAQRKPGEPSALLVKKDLDEFVVILTCDDPDSLGAASAEFVAHVQQRAVSLMRSRLRVGVGAPQLRLCELNRSYSSAILQLHAERQDDFQMAGSREAAGAELLLLEQGALEDYLKFGTEADFAAMFSTYVGALSPAALQSAALRSYLWIEILVTAARSVHHLGGNVELVFPELRDISAPLGAVGSLNSLRDQTRTLCARAIEYRDSQARHRNATVIRRARTYLDQHYATPSLSLNEVAAHVSLSPNHFSTVFSSETGATFKEYLTQLRIDKAKELLRTTALNTNEIFSQVGYSDPHYFGVAFKKATGLSPRQFRALGSGEAMG